MNRLVRQASALMSSTVVASFLNMVFWVVAARLYPTGEVGHGSAAISAVMLVAGLAQLNLLSVFVRFLPHAGRRTTAFLASGHAGILLASLLLGGAYLLFGPAIGFARRDGSGGVADPVAFVLAVAVFALFYVQDGALTTFGRANFVLGKNLSTGLAKLALLVVLVAGGSRLGIAASWCVPMAVAVVATTVALFGRFAPRHSQGDSALPGARQLGSFVAAEYVNNLVSNVVTLVPPLIVLHVLGATSNAYFAVPWMIVITLQTLLWNIMVSFITESGRHPEATVAHGRRTAVLVAGVATVGTLGLVVAAPLLLLTQGGAFADAGTGLLRIGALSFPFSAVVIFASAFAMLDNRLWRLAALQAVAAAGFLGGSIGLLPHLGISGVGVAYLVTQALVALVLFPGLVRRLRGTTSDEPLAGASPSAVGTLARWLVEDLRIAVRHTWLNTVAGSRLMPRVGRYVMYRLARVRTASPNVVAGTIVDGPPSNLTIGARVFVNSGCYLETVGPVSIGADTMVGMRVTIVTSHHPTGPEGRPLRAVEPKPVRVGERVWLGAGAIVLPGVTIGDDVVVAAGAVVVKDLPAGAVYGGNPARHLKDLHLKTVQNALNGIDVEGLTAAGEVPFPAPNTSDRELATLEK